MAEKITINLEPVDLGRIDLLVGQGLYSNRTDLIRTAIRNQLARHDAVIEEVVVKQSFVIGVTHFDRADLERRVAAGERLRVRVVGLLHVAEDVDADLARQAFDSVTVHGVYVAPDDVQAAFPG